MFSKCKLVAGFPVAIYYTILLHQSYMDFLYFFTFLVFSANLNVICARIHKPMAKKRFRITEKDFLLANRKASREEEIAKYGKQIMFRTTTQKSKKVYDRKRLKKAGINSGDLPLVIISLHACTYFSNVYGSIYGPTASIMRKLPDRFRVASAT